MNEIVNISENKIVEKIVNSTVMDLGDGIDSRDEKSRRQINERQMLEFYSLGHLRISEDIQFYLMLSDDMQSYLMIS